MLAGALDDAIERSAAPGTVGVVVQRLRDERPDAVERIETDRSLRDAVVAVTAASRSLTQVVLVDDAAVEVLADLDQRPAVPEGGPDELVRWKRLELLRVAARDLLGLDGLEVTGRLLADLAGDVLQAAWRMTDDRPERLAIVGMGKQGGRELNYASDVDVMFVGDGEREARQLMDVARRCFRVDANLRPEGRDGPLVRSVESYDAYWQRWAEPWEFQALLKARHTAGDPTIGAAFDAAAATRLWGRTFSADDLRSLRAMKARAEAEVARKGLSDREVKRGRGGLRDIEFAVQLLQLVHGRHDPELRSPTTLVALEVLASAGYVESDDAAALADAYRFLRAVEHRLQLVDEQQVHAVPTDLAARTRLARVMGFRDTAGATAAEQLDEALRRHQATVRSIHERVYFRPLLEAFSESGAMSPAAAEERLAAFGFAEADRTRQAVRELTRGLTRSSRLMQQMLPLLLGWLADSPDPDLGLLGLRTLATGGQRANQLANAFRDSPEVARRLCTLLGTSRIITDGLAHNPDLIAPLGGPEAAEPGTRERYLGDARTALSWRADVDARGRALRRFKDREMLQIAARDVLDMADVEQTGRELTALAEATVEAALEALAPTMPFAVVAMGRFGGGELSYASDLDVLFVYDGGTPSDFEEAERLATTLLRFVAGATPAARIYDVDADLRPEGKQGPLARSLEGYRTYFERWAEVWERQAMVRARPVAGDPSLGGGLLEAVRPHVWREDLSADDVREIRRIKARVERERIPAGEDPQFHLKLGRGSLSDVEWTVQLLQLRHGVRSQGTMEALGRLVERDVLDADDAAVLADSYRFCERARNRWFLVKGGQGDSLPRQAPQLARLARSLDTTPVALREDYRRVTRRARQVVERVFYERAQ